MKQFYFRLIKLLTGLFFCALGIAFTINARIGFSPWDVFHAGLASTLRISIGTASIATGILILLLIILLGEKVGLGTLLNMILIGMFLDLILNLRIIPVSNNFITGIIMLIIGMIIFSFATYLYIQSAFGAGPRDSLMVALSRKTGYPIGFCRGLIELIVALIGWKLGGMIGIGTVLFAFLIGLFIQITFKIFKFDATKVKHETFENTIKQCFTTIREINKS